MSTPRRAEPAQPVGAVLEASYRDFADRMAVVDGPRSLTYRKLGERADRIAAGLRELGCRPGDRVVLIAPNCLEWVEVDHACYRGNFIRVGPITRLHVNELAEIVADADAKVVVAESAWLAQSGTTWIPPSVTAVVSFGEQVLPGVLSLEQVVDRGGDSFVPDPAHERDVWIMYTSGSTGRAKGVLSTGSGVGAMVRNTLAEMPDLSCEDVAVHTAPLSHFSGAIALPVFAVGGTNVVLPRFDLQQLCDAIHDHDLSVLPLVPTQINMLVDELVRRRDLGRPVDTSAIRCLVYAGSAIAPDRLAAAKRMLGDILLQFYGASESPLPLTALHPKDHVDIVVAGGPLPRLASAGRPGPYGEVRVTDPEGNVVAPLSVGSIEVRGQQTMSGYWRMPEATAAVLDADGWLTTGDVGYLDHDGYLFIVDRSKDMIVTGGFNVYPREVENVISSMPDVRQVAVVSAPSERWGEEIVAVVSVRPGRKLGHDDVDAWCRAHIAGYKCPRRVVVVDEVPVNAVGKIDKRRLSDEFWEGAARRV